MRGIAGRYGAPATTKCQCTADKNAFGHNKREIVAVSTSSPTQVLFQINLGNVNAAAGGKQGNLPSGFYKVAIETVEAVQASTGRWQIKFRTIINDKGWTGIPRTFRINVPTGQDDKVLAYWRAAYESIGWTDAQFAGVTGVQMAHFIGKSAYIDYKSKEETGSEYDECNFTTPAAYAAADQAAAVMGSALGNGASPAPAPALGGLGGMGGLVPAPAAAPALGGMGMPMSMGGAAAPAPAAAPATGASLLQQLQGLGG